MAEEDGKKGKSLPIGIYETLINEDTAERIQATASDDKLQIEKTELKKHDAPTRLLASYVKEVVQDTLQEQQIDDQVITVNNLMWRLHKREDILRDGSWLKQVRRKKARDIPRPQESISFISIFTGGHNSIASELKKEILSADSIDLLISFIKKTGLNILLEQLKEVSRKNPAVKIRVITTCYMGATDASAVEMLRKECNAEIKINYDTTSSRLHAKAYIFKRNSGFDTAYVGSSNMSDPALKTGLEWNVKLAKKESPEAVKKLEEQFEEYWYQENLFVPYKEGDEEMLAKILQQHKRPTGIELGKAFEPYDYQRDILDDIKNERANGYYKNLVVAATGTGKTMIAAFDYRDWKAARDKEGKSSKLLFIAHREEILEQSIKAFRNVLGDENFGDMLVGGAQHPKDMAHLFCSIQSFNSRELWASGDKQYYDYIVVDEFHHAAAESYQKLLSFYGPVVLLGLTATPERMDGKDIRYYFGGRFASELRLPEAIELGLLCHFDYFGITDVTDLSKVKWVNGSYDVDELTDLYTMESHNAGKRAGLIFNSTLQYVDDLDNVKGIGFCVSRTHARYMADYFNRNGLDSIALVSKGTDEKGVNLKEEKEKRKKARKALQDGEIKFIFTVDLYNEGVDIPQVNTVLFLRPTQSLTVFLQQLGRGLRLYEDKRLTVLDFIAQANEKYSFAERFQALMPRTRDNTDIEKQIVNYFPNLPSGCTIQLQKMAERYILKNISENIQTASNLLKKFQMMTGLEPTLTNFFSAYPDMKSSIYSDGSFTTALRKAHLTDIKPDTTFESSYSKGLYKMSQINSRKWITFLKQALTADDHDWTEEEKIMLRMLNATFMTSGKPSKVPLEYGLDVLKEHDYLKDEIEELLTYNYNTAAQERRNILPYPSALEIYSEYTRDQILLAFGYDSSPYAFQAGVKYFEEYNTDIFLITLNKPDDTKLSLKYQDYAMNKDIFHWQSQSDTTPESVTGKRYISKSSTVLLFVRNDKKDPVTGETELYTFLGPCKFISSEGSAPMTIKWKMDYPIPNKFLKHSEEMQIM